MIHIDTAVDERRSHSFGAALGQRLVVRLSAVAVRVTFNCEMEAAAVFYNTGKLVEYRPALFIDGCGVTCEDDERTGECGREFVFASGLCRSCRLIDG